MTRKRDLGILATVTALGIGCLSPKYTTPETKESYFQPKQTKHAVVERELGDDISTIVSSTTASTPKKVQSSQKFNAYDAISDLKSSMNKVLETYSGKKGADYGAIKFSARHMIDELKQYQPETFKQSTPEEHKEIYEACKHFNDRFNDTTKKLIKVIGLYKKFEGMANKGTTVTGAHQKQYKTEVETLKASSEKFGASSKRLEKALDKYRIER